MSLTPGTRLGPFEIAALIGVGGMGEVYQATDTSLKRQVAIKILPASVAGDPDRLARFQREAEVLASINHAHIASVYGLEDAGGTKALVMELVEGLTLADRVAHGPLPIDDALPIARQIVEALDAAHQQGIIHRDLKPANIKLRPDGVVKVLDFGLAKALDPSGAPSHGVSRAPTITTPAMTQAGVILGTAAYMSPEQARGKGVDKRADIWAFGCVLHEMLTGRRLFDGDEVSDTLAFVLTREPDWTALPPGTPPAIRRLLRRCLAKDRNNRLPDIASARLELDDAHAELSQSTPDIHARAPQRASVPRIAVWASAVVALAALSFAVWTVMRARPSNQPLLRASISMSPAERLLSGVRIDTSIGRGRPSRTSMVFTPDGRALVFSGEREGRVQLYLRRLDQLDATPIAGTEDASNPFFSPDGQSLAFHADGALKRVPIDGGPVVVLCPVAFVFGASWSRTDQIVFAEGTGGLLQVPAAGGTPTPATRLDSNAGEVSHRLPHFLPDGKTLLFTVTRAPFPSWDDTTIVAQSLDTGERKVIVDGGADARFVETTRHLVYLRRGTLMAVAFDAVRLQAGPGAAVALVGDVMQAASIQPVQIDTGAGQFAVSASGSLAYATGGIYGQDRWSIVWVDRMGRVEPLKIPPGAYLAPRLSPDGQRVAFSTSTGDWDLWTYDVTRQVATRLPLPGEQSIPLWTRDGTHLVFLSMDKGTRRVLSLSADGSGTPATMVEKGGWPNTWAPDGELGFILDGQLWLAPPDGKTAPRALTLSAGPRSTQFDFSPDGQWLAYDLRPNFNSEGNVYAHRYPALDRREQISVENGAGPAWRQDGRELYYMQNVSNDGPLKIRMMAVPITTTPAFSVGTPHVLFEGPYRTDGPFRSYDVTPDGQRFLMVREIDQPPTRVTHLVLVQNWTEELTRLVPVK